MPLAKTHPVSSAFVTLLERASRDPEAAAGLALAYAAFAPPIRRALVEAIVTDAASGSVEVSTVLVALLGVEPDAELCRDIACALSAAASGAPVATGRERALFAGDETRGALLYARPLFGPFLETLLLRWTRDGGVSRAHFLPLATEETVERIEAEADPDLRFEEVPVTRAFDRAAVVLWEHRKRHGELPEALLPFAALFSLSAADRPD